MPFQELRPIIVILSEKVNSFQYLTLIGARANLQDEVKEALQNCKIIESYPNDYPFPSGLVVGYTRKKRAIHAVVVIDDQNKEEGMPWIITVYEPNILEWQEGFEKRRK